MTTNRVQPLLLKSENQVQHGLSRQHVFDASLQDDDDGAKNYDKVEKDDKATNDEEAEEDDDEAMMNEPEKDIGKSEAVDQTGSKRITEECICPAVSKLIVLGRLSVGFCRYSTATNTLPSAAQTTSIQR